MSYVHRDERRGYHHVVTRGNNQRRIFEDDVDRWFFCITVDRIAKKHGWNVLAYCLMDNHYHLVLEIGELGLSGGMCELNTACALNYNARHGRINHLFGKRYWNRFLRTHATVVNALRYVVQNPRRAGGSLPLEAYVWSSYAATIGVAYARIRLDRDQVLQFFGRTPERAIEEYRMYCAAMPLGSHVHRQPP
jgi:putative transposase